MKHVGRFWGLGLSTLLLFSGCGDSTGPCEGMLCNTPPANYCDGDSAVVYADDGTCADGSCSYTSQTVVCDEGCSEGACNGDPCAGIVCDEPPNTQCYEVGSGHCEAEPTVHCEYTPATNDTGCDDGDPCTDTDLCTDGTCAGVQKTCNTPPADACQDVDTLTTYQSTGSCSDGICTYSSDPADCEFGCADGACNGDPCAGIACDEPPNTQCYEVGSGHCEAEPTVHCEYTPVTNDTDCDDGDPCTDTDLCTDGACAGVQKTCNTPPADYCDGDSLMQYPDTGVCDGGDCSYSPDSVNCPYGCADGECNPCSSDCSGLCGGADDGCGETCMTDCPAGQYCDNQLCVACTVPDACGESCEDCVGNTAGHDCIFLAPDYVCGCDANDDCGGDEACHETTWQCVTVGEFVPIEAGAFEMGSPEDEAGRVTNEVQYTVTLNGGFEILSTEVTQGRFGALMGYNPSDFTACGTDCPVERVNWYEAAAYCNAISAIVGSEICYTCTGTGLNVICEPNDAYATPYDCPGYRLPTEAEWEYAARAGSITATYNGDLDDTHLQCEQPNDMVDPIAWFCGNSSSTTHAVGTRDSNDWDLYDMLGNVWEWCHDWYGDYPVESAADPWGVATGSRRVLRGGSWVNVARYVRAAIRGRNDPTFRNFGLGFRLVRSYP